MSRDAVLHCFVDPLCAWCHGAAPLVEAARPVLHVQWHAGGLRIGPMAQPVSDAWQAMSMQHDARIAQITGQPFGTAYTEGLLNDRSAVLDSEPPITAMLAADELGGRGLDMLLQLQRAHYVDGLHIASEAVLVSLAGQLGLPGERFRKTLRQLSGPMVQRHMQAGRGLMEKLGAPGYPSFVVEAGGQFKRLTTGAYLGRPTEFAEHLKTWTSNASAKPVQLAAERIAASH